ncbi:MAG: pyridoxamine 5'-phosphate oxidase family protein [Dactylosporangium sp.]|nr:pyridoxamine 5'-phosphate oxidase family protein [Dactylosporangium sp.]NNJ63845.1 pyridoxamine 5'-phosphate oxidase family protein [Dactylosporangium sp.]
MATAPTSPAFDPTRQLDIARRAIAKHSFCVLATSSAKNRPHAVGILYAAVDLTLYLLTGENTVKIRNIRENPKVAVSIPVRKYPFAPPMAVQFQGVGAVLAVDDPHIQPLLGTGRLKRITSFGALDTPGACFITVTPHRRISTYGLGIPLARLLRDLSGGARSVELP